MRISVCRRSSRPFDLATGSMLRAVLFRLAPDDHVTGVVAHHIACDARSSEIFIGELSALYAAHAAGGPHPLPALGVQYADYAAWQRARLDRTSYDRLSAFWRGRLNGAPPVLELRSPPGPSAHPTPTSVYLRMPCIGHCVS